jgi:GMP synthase (glutamine-hydrolysing)
MKTAVALRHLAFEDLGLLESWLKARGWRIHYYDVGVDELWRLDLGQVDLLIVLGGPIGAFDDADYPYLSEAVEIVAQRIVDKRPLLGICLGALYGLQRNRLFAFDHNNCWCRYTAF